MSQNRFTLIASLALMFFAQQLAAQFTAVHVVANMGRYSGYCPTTILFTGSIDFNPPGNNGFVFNYHWERSDGAKTAVTVVRPGPYQRAYVVRNPWRLGGPGMHYSAWQKLYVNSGNTHIVEASPAVSVNCR